MIRTVKKAEPAGPEAQPGFLRLPARAGPRAAALGAAIAGAALVTPAARHDIWALTALAAFATVCFWRPPTGALLTVALSPILTIAVSLGLDQGGMWSEALVLTALVGWLGRLLVHGAPAPPRHLAAPAAVFAGIVAVSLLVVLAEWRTRLSPEAFWPALAMLLRYYTIETAGLGGAVRAGARVLEGVGLMLMLSSVCGEARSRRQVLRMVVVGAAAVATFNINRLVAGALRSDTPWLAFVDLVQTVRLSLPYSDVNAAGSYFALALIVACALAGTSRAPWPARLLWIPLIALNVAGVWISQSRAALLAVAIAAAAAAIVRVRRTGLLPLAALGAATIVAIWIFPNPVIDRSAVGAIGIRAELARVAGRLTATAPVFGIGIGTFYERSGEHIEDPYVRDLYPSENAHNNFLQYLAELGVIGLGAFLWVLWAAIAAGRSARPPDHDLLTGVRLALAAFLLTCLGGHPLLIEEVSYAFWGTLGVVAAAAFVPPSQAPVRTAVAAAVLIVVLAFAPWRLLTAAHATNLDHVGHGVSQWQRDGDGTRYRTTSGSATLFVPSGARAVDIPLRLEPGAAPVTVEITFRGRVADRVTVGSESWQAYRLMVTAARNDPRYLPVHLRVVAGEAEGLAIGRTGSR